MNYRLSPPDPKTPHRTTLTRTASYQRVTALALRAIAVGCWLGTIVVLAQRWQWPPPDMACWLAGAGCLAWAFNLLTGRPWRMPSHFVFDNQQGALLLQGKDSQGQPLEACLPYEDIRAFRVRRIDAKANTQQPRYYEVEMQKNDGAFWTIHQTQTREEAESFCDVLEQKTALFDAPQTIDEVSTSAGQIQLRETEGSSTLSWRERTPMRLGICWMMLNLGLLCLCLSLHIHLPPVAWQVLLGCLGLFAFFGLTYALLSLGRRHTIHITEDMVRYIHPQSVEEEDGLRCSFTMKAKDIHTILFNFSLDPSTSRLFVLRAGETRNLLRHKRGQAGLGRAETLEHMLRRISQIDAQELSFAEQLHLEYALQHIIQRRCDHKVE